MEPLYIFLSILTISIGLVAAIIALSMTIAAIFSTILFLFVPLSIALLLSIIILRIKFSSKRDNSVTSIGFFHPYCTAGGGGERVLWQAIKTTQEHYPDIKIFVYTGDTIPDSQIFDKVKNTFDIELNRNNCKFKRLLRRKWVEASTFPRFTLIGQSLGSMVLAYEALTLLNPTIFIDTMGYAFSYPIFSILAGSTVACYVHYPTISSDMISRVQSNSESFNNSSTISRSKILTLAKLIYYNIFAKIYWIVGSMSKLVLANGTWTGNHIANIWKKEIGKDLFVVYPPVDVESRKELPLDWMNRKNVILSISQFRPEKNQALQIQTLAHLLSKYPVHKNQLNTKLILVGSTRDQGDRDRVEQLKQLAHDLGVANHVDFQIGVSASELNNLFSEASVGIHTMTAEHFGIGVVEMMAAGVIPVAHNSAGPKEDIVKPDITGFLATTKEEYAEYIHEILAYREKYTDMQKKARESVDRFSDENFNSNYLKHMKPLIDSCVTPINKKDQ
ncbi:hypothetical protein CYY_003521 [Polysphondylium violaceum]|uniref:GDP-Man:Man(3)GlcNAc(2)-PP-Dol alpha-1,2-mannosyltransferase n=1 Tax=Polysphondylium violaceum TaxID=133409 RepID=A0A8J4PW89_9MYCE|nr:hypothetical protein CYY_003521 [Polysphondylium violaceum]